MASNITISLKEGQKEYLQGLKVSPSQLMQEVIGNMQKGRTSYEDFCSHQECDLSIEKLRDVIDKLQRDCNSLHEQRDFYKKRLEVLEYGSESVPPIVSKRTNEQ